MESSLRNSDEDPKEEKCPGDPSDVALRLRGSRGQSSALGPPAPQAIAKPPCSQRLLPGPWALWAEVRGFRDGLPWAGAGSEGQQERLILGKTATRSLCRRAEQ